MKTFARRIDSTVPQLRFIVLAAGNGTRLRPLTDNLPKAMIPLPDGEALLAHTLAVLGRDERVDEVIIVGGYEYEILRCHVDSRWAPRCWTVFNPDYDSKGPIYSVRCGLLGGPSESSAGSRDSYIAIMNGDTWFSQAALHEMLAAVAAAPSSALLFGSQVSEFASDDMRVRTRGDFLVHVGKGIAGAQMISAGCCVLPPRGATALRGMLASIETGPHPEMRTWHEALNHLVEAGEQVELRRLSREDWQEIDDEDDLKRLARRLTAR